MKRNFLYTGLICLFSVWFAFQSCNNEQNDSTNSEFTPQSYKNHLIDKRSVETLRSEFLKNNNIVLSNYRQSKNLKTEDTKEIVYPIEVLQGYVDYVRSKVAKEKQKNLYIVFYLGQYPFDKIITSQQNESDKGNQTFLIKSFYVNEENVFSAIGNIETLKYGRSGDLDFKNHFINASDTKLLYETFTENNYKILKERRESLGLSGEESRMYYYSIDVMEGYLKYVKEEANKRGISKVNIAINIGQYPTNELIDSRQKPIYKGYQCIYLKPLSGNTQNTNKSSDPDPLDEIEAMDMTNLSPPPNHLYPGLL